MKYLFSQKSWILPYFCWFRRRIFSIQFEFQFCLFVTWVCYKFQVVNFLDSTGLNHSQKLWLVLNLIERRQLSSPPICCRISENFQYKSPPYSHGLVLPCMVLSYICISLFFVLYILLEMSLPDRQIVWVQGFYPILTILPRREKAGWNLPKI